MTNQPQDSDNDARALLLERLDAIIQMVEAASYDPARQALFVGKWTQEVEAEELPDDLLKDAIAQTDAAHAALSRWPPDTEGAKALLQAARELLA